MADGIPPRLRSTPWLIALLALVLLAVGLTAAGPVLKTRVSERPLLSEAASPVASLAGQAADLKAGDDGRFPTIIRRPDGPPTIAMTSPDPQGRMGEIACSTCHSVREPNYQNRTATDLEQFHQKMPIAHGQIACYACHNPDDTDTLRLADSSPVKFADVMTLCSQCHGQQARDYKHGAHGGMNGYWDLTRGPRTRNNCVDCHDPHMPAFPKMQPTFKPRDRFLDPHHSNAPRQDQGTGHNGAGLHSAGRIQTESEGHGG